MRKKSLLILIIAAMILSVFAACSGENSSKLTYKMLEDDTYEVSIGVDPLDVKGKVNIP